MPPAPSSSRALNAILPQIATAPYEAHQKARTFASRYVKSGQHDVAIDVLFQSARELFKAGQAGSGVDLTGFLLEVYETKGETVSDESRGRLTQLIALAGTEGAWRKTIIDKSLAFDHSAAAGRQCMGQVLLVMPSCIIMLESCSIKAKGAFEAAEPHFLASSKRDSARLLAEMFLEWSAVDIDSLGAFSLRGTLPYLLNGNILCARTFITQFVTSLPRASDPPLSVGPDAQVILVQDPVVNFAQLAVLTCQRAQGDRNKAVRESWVRLCGTYQSKGGLLASPEVRGALNEIATLYFAFPPPRGQAGNPLGDMLSSLLGGGSSGGPARRALAPAAALTASGLD
ncbi:hypothetical protein MIND_00213600 [Mycena indigotica]|uniref:Cytoplasmic protein n=1 Tax=Mycena indigotica TaxID=2126181 RepID=A0A8H6WBP0_9AGAR|nr:uncharacterized protein MIND_00213600 [Mycena indigotica]KAF7312017.1 hypothetical protein MIND_00213600 [Mycena indigotica]